MEAMYESRVDRFTGMKALDQTEFWELGKDGDGWKSTWWIFLLFIAVLGCKWNHKCPADQVGYKI